MAVALTYRPSDPVQQKLEFVNLGMTQDEVETAMDMPPTVLTEWRGMDVLTFQGRSGVAEVQISQQTWRVVGKGWSPDGRESPLVLVWRWLWD